MKTLTLNFDNLIKTVCTKHIDQALCGNLTNWSTLL